MIKLTGYVQVQGRSTHTRHAKSLLEQLPEIVALGRKQAEKILEGIESRQRITLQTREVVLPAKDSAVQDWIASQARTAQREVFAQAWQGWVRSMLIDHADDPALITIED